MGWSLGNGGKRRSNCHAEGLPNIEQPDIRFPRLNAIMARIIRTELIHHVESCVDTNKGAFKGAPLYNLTIKLLTNLKNQNIPKPRRKKDAFQEVY